ncbi:MAG TPA: zinc ABC transporter substrate-binding protein [Acidothermaceae bacterium]|nr:zinc ABC transporter substrate-binding protein [Acidothermaceae bacterium]
MPQRHAGHARHAIGALARGALRASSGLVVVALAAACATTPAHTNDGGKIRVVAAEDFWGSIARSLGGDHVAVDALINSPVIDPHDYEPTASDARAVATAGVVVVNGVGYDGWASKLLAANPSSRRSTIDVGKVVGAKSGDNPHRWYNPDDVRAVVTAITNAYSSADPRDAAYFAEQRDRYEAGDLGRYEQLIADIKAKYAGTPVGASESIFAMLAPALGLRLITPGSFMRAISEGADPTASDKRLIDKQIRDREIKVYVYNSQNTTPDVRAQVNAAAAAGIPVVAITESPVPATASFTDWQIAQLNALQAALAKGAHE